MIPEEVLRYIFDRIDIDPAEELADCVLPYVPEIVRGADVNAF